MARMSLGVSVHHPVVESVKLYQRDGSWVVTLGDSCYSNTVTLFTTYAEWDAIVERVAEERGRIAMAPTDNDVIEDAT